MAAKMTYGEQLKHPFWQRRRLEIFNRAGFKCEKCYDSESTLHVHHKHYIKGRMAWEYENKELVALCETCHEESHQAKEQFNLLLASLRVDGPFSIDEAASLVAGWASSFVDEDLAYSFQDRPLAFHLGMLAGQIDQQSPNIDLLLSFIDCAADGGDDFISKLTDFLHGYVPPAHA